MVRVCVFCQIYNFKRSLNEWNNNNREVMKEIKFKEEDGRIVVEDNETDALREINDWGHRERERQDCLEHLKARYSYLIENYEVKQALGDLFYSSPFKLRRRNRG